MVSLKVCVIGISLALFAINVEAGKIVEMQVKTDTEPDSEMDNGGFLHMAICGTTQCCQMINLDTQFNDFQQGAVDSFVGQYLQNCDNFELEDDSLKALLVTHRGDDAWNGEWIRILLDSGKFFDCAGPGWLDNDEFANVQCTP